ncbi:TspO/MBR family protein [Stutzerimonas tarimensis]|uniref:TspO/MBR family protein n=1 Tax=Stutzerimonas tarimensis TaxID=1507735 RepID=A0ABV7T335_9GAMM
MDIGPKFRQALGLAAWLALTFLAAGVGAIASADAGALYAQLQRPAWTPPAAAFGPVWSLLYLLMGVAAWLVWREQAVAGRRLALGLFIVQLAVNALWTWLFFAWRLGALAFADALLLAALIVATTLAFWRVRRLAGVLLLPYLAWVGFACVLTWTLWRGNPAMLG